jgi:hypothetical protein
VREFGGEVQGDGRGQGLDEAEVEEWAGEGVYALRLGEGSRSRVE